MFWSECHFSIEFLQTSLQLEDFSLLYFTLCLLTQINIVLYFYFLTDSSFVVFVLPADYISTVEFASLGLDGGL